MVNAAFHNAGERFGQFFLVYVVLVLPYANGLRLNFYKLRQRVLHPACYGNGTAQRNVKLGQFFARQLGGRIYGSPCFADNGIGNVKPVFFNHLRGKFFRFVRCCAVADGNKRYAVSVYKV